MDASTPISSAVVVPTVADAIIAHRVRRLRNDPALRQRFGARALHGDSAILAAVAYILHGDDPHGEHGAPSPAQPAGIGMIDLGGGGRAASAWHRVDDQAEATDALPLESEAGTLDNADDRRLDGAPIALTGEA